MIVEKIYGFRCVSTRKVQEIVAHLGMDQLSPSSVSRIAHDLDDQVKAFLNRPIEQPIPYLYVDAAYFKVRDGPRYVSKAQYLTNFPPCLFSFISAPSLLQLYWVSEGRNFEHGL